MNKNLEEFIKSLKFKDGLIPAIIQDEKSKKVLTLCYMNEEAVIKTFETGNIYLFRRSQNTLMMKGGTSGNIQVLKKAFVDCKGNSLLYIVKQKIAGCHEGYFTCFFRKFDKNGKIKISEKRIFDPKKVYKK